MSDTASSGKSKWTIWLFSALVLCALSFCFYFLYWKRVNGRECAALSDSEAVASIARTVIGGGKRSNNGLVLGKYVADKLYISRIRREASGYDDMGNVEVYYSEEGREGELFSMVMFDNCELQWIQPSMVAQ